MSMSWDALSGPGCEGVDAVAECGLAEVVQILGSAADRFCAHIGGRYLPAKDRQLLEPVMTTTARIVIGMALNVDPAAEYPQIRIDPRIDQTGHTEHRAAAALLLVRSVPR